MKMSQSSECISLLTPPLSVREGYAPCEIPLRDLEPIDNLTDLIVESHHIGRVIFVKTFAEPARIEAIVNAVEDAAGNVDRLALFHMSQRVSPEEVLPRGTVLAIKEPWFRRAQDGGVVIRVDHPSNAMIVDTTNPLVPAAWRAKQVVPTLTEITVEASEMMVKNCFQAANVLFTEALKLLHEDCDKHEAVRRSLHRSRANARLSLEHFEDAVEDALQGITPGTPKTLSKQEKDGNVQAYNLIASTHYLLAEFADAKQYLEQALALLPHHDKAGKRLVKENLQRTEKRLKEQKTGVYDFAAMSASATLNNRSLDHASFLSNTEIRPAGAHGRGLFATKKIEVGEVIMVEKSMFNIWTDRIGAKSGDLKIDWNDEHLFDVWSNLSCNPRKAAAFFELYDGDDSFYFKKDGKKKMTLATNIDGKQVILDVFQIRAVLDHNLTPCAEVKSSLCKKFLLFEPDKEEQQVGEKTLVAETKHNNKNDNDDDDEEEEEGLSKDNAKTKGKKKSKGKKKNKGKQIASTTPSASTPASSPPRTHAPAVASSSTTATRDDGGSGSYSGPKSSFGIWHRASYMNHSCLPNAYRAFIGDMMIVRATRQIPDGGEILVQYVDPTLPYADRQKALAAWNIARCDCPLCEVEASLPAEMLAKRLRVARQSADFLEEDRKKSRFQRRPPCRIVQSRFFDLARELGATYPEDLYDSLPRFEMLKLGMWMVETSITPWQAIDSAQMILRDVGIKTRFSRVGAQMLEVNRTGVGSGVVPLCVMDALLVVADAKRVVHTDKAKRAVWKLRRMAEQFHLMLFGEELVVPPGLYYRPWPTEAATTAAAK